MSLNKIPIEMNFAEGLDTKTDPNQVPIGKFLALKNSVFTKAGQLTKRNGFGALGSLSDTSSLLATTFNGNLTAIGNKIQSYDSATQTWYNKGPLQPVSLSVLPLVRSNTNQSQADTAVAPNGLACTVYIDNPPSGAVCKYVICNSITGQNVTAPAPIPVTSGTVSGGMRVFVLGNYFILLFTNAISATNHLQYVAISTADPTQVKANADISSVYVPASTLSFDGVVVGSNLYVAWASTGSTVKITALTQNLSFPFSPTSYSAKVATIMSVCADVTVPSSPIIYATFYNLGTTAGFSVAVDQNLNKVTGFPVQWVSSGTIKNVSTAAQNAILTVIYEVSNAYSYDSGIATNYLKLNTITSTGTLGTAAVLIRSVGLASKAFIFSGSIYVLAAYSSSFQPTYFLINSSGNAIAKLAYSNGGGYCPTGTPSVTVVGTVARVAYLIKDLVSSSNKTQGAASATPVYSQTGVNLASCDLMPPSVSSAEIGQELNISGGFMWGYDGYSAVEQGFHLWPDSVEVTTSTTGGLLSDQKYFYQVTYEWADNQGNVFRSAPSVPVSQTTSGGGTSTNTINVPTLRVTYKTANPVKIVVYRWSTAQQTYYAIQSPAVAPVFNDPTVDSVTITDTSADASIIGNPILYTTGGVIENIGAPATDLVALAQSRLFFVYAEDRNLLGFSKQVIEATPVELSDLLTIYVPPTTAAEGSTGPMTALSAMDDKLIIFKQNAAYYINGSGPDNTGANSQFSDPIFITATVGCANQQSIVMIPQGLMFQSGKGIWLLDRGLNTSYIGAPVEEFNSNTVLSAISVPNTNQVRFTLDSGVTLMYDYYYNQWGTFIGVPALSSVVYQGLHTYINNFGQAFQETPGLYLDGSAPVLLGFKTGWINFAGLQGYERFYQTLLLGKYLSPFKLNVQYSYDYIPSVTQSTLVSPLIPGSLFGLQPGPFGSGSPFGGNETSFKARIFPQKQKCESFQVTVDEQYDPSFGITAGGGLTLSGMQHLVGVKKGSRTQSAGRSFG